MTQRSQVRILPGALPGAHCPLVGILRARRQSSGPASTSGWASARRGSRSGMIAAVDLGSLLTLGLLALFLAAQPWSVLAAVLLVTSRRGVVKESAYAAGWLSALAVVAVATVLLYPDVPRSATTGHGHALVEVVLGVVLAGRSEEHTLNS